MTKQEFVDRVADKAGLSRREAAKCVEAFTETVTEALAAGDSVAFTGFGKFAPVTRSPRLGVHPVTREPMNIPAATVPKFSAGSQLKQAVKG